VYTLEVVGMPPSRLQRVNYRGLSAGRRHLSLRSTRELIAVAAILTAGIADLATTAIGFHVGLVESNPTALHVLEAAGLPGLAAVQLAFSALFASQLAWCTYGDRTHPTAQALVLVAIGAVTIVWAAAAGWNAALILEATQ
jgi:hypothetical protein